MYAAAKLGVTLEAQHKWPGAEPIYREALSISSKKGDQNPEALSDLQKLVHVLLNEHKYSEAQTLLDKVLTPTFDTQAASADLLEQRVNLFGRRGRWQHAADAATVAVKTDPTENRTVIATVDGLLVSRCPRTPARLRTTLPENRCQIQQLTQSLHS